MTGVQTCALPILKQENALLREKIKLTETGREALEKKIELQQQLIELQVRTIDNMNGMMNTQRDQCRALLKQARPTFFDELKKALSYTGIGVLIGAAIFAL